MVPLHCRDTKYFQMRTSSGWDFRARWKPHGGNLNLAENSEPGGSGGMGGEETDSEPKPCTSVRSREEKTLSNQSKETQSRALAGNVRVIRVNNPALPRRPQSWPSIESVMPYSPARVAWLHLSTGKSTRSGAWSRLKKPFLMHDILTSTPEPFWRR